MMESIDKIKDLCVDLEIELEKINETVKIQKGEDGNLHVVKDDTGEDCSVDFAIVIIYIFRIFNFIDEYAKKINEKLESIDPDWEKTIEEYLEKNNRK